MALIWDKRSMGDILKERVDVPEYQRPYAWEGDNVMDFFNDLTSFIQSEEEQYLFGQIIMHREGNVFHVVDGQQRICTSVIFVKAIHDCAVCIRDTDPELSSNNVLNNLISNTSRAIADEDDDGEYTRFKFSIAGAEMPFFTEYILHGNHQAKAGRGGPKKKLKNAYDNLYSSLMEKVDSLTGTDKVTALREYFRSFTEGFYVSYVESENLGQAFVVFETLNNRGRVLEPKDLVKNYVIRYAKSKNLAVQKWTDMETLFSKIKGEKELFSTYIRYYWNSCHTFTRKKELYRNITDALKDDVGAIDAFLTDLYVNSSVFASLVQMEPARKISSAALHSLRDMTEAGASSFYPIVIAMMRNNDVTKENIEDVLEALETLIVRNQVIGGQVANKNEVRFAEYALDITNGVPIETIIERIRGKTNSDESIRSTFVTFQPNKSSAKFLLRALYWSPTSETVVDESNTNIHLEHIMPVAIGEWDIEENQHKEYCQYFGNMTLLQGKINRSLQNDLFPQKKMKYAESNYSFTKELAEYDDWGVDEIVERQSMLCEKVLERWPLASVPATRQSRLKV